MSKKSRFYSFNKQSLALVIMHCFFHFLEHCGSGNLARPVAEGQYRFHKKYIFFPPVKMHIIPEVGSSLFFL